MIKQLFAIVLFVHFVNSANAQKADSLTVRLHPAYDDVNGFHRLVFGENYRKEWSVPAKLPVIKLSEIHGGLTPVKVGGGFQTSSLRLVDKNGKEWVLRGVEKNAEKILPEELRETFAKDWVDDAMSAQHPYSALIVPPLAKAAGVPHATPIIGVVAADGSLGEYSETFVGKICLLEEREPIGDTDNTLKMMANLDKDNKYSFDARAFLKARLLDLLIGDWDRHADQWRWVKLEQKENNLYLPVPRDRDQVFYTNQGIFPYIASRSWVAPNLQGFDGKIKNIRYSLWKTVFMDRYPATNISHEEWTSIVNEFIKAETDEVLEAGLKQLPLSVYMLRHDALFKQLKERRDNIPAAMEEYYQFKNKIVDIRTSDKHELVTITGTENKGLKVLISKVGKNDEIKDTLMNHVFTSDITKEIRLYVGAGNDRVVIDNKTSAIKLRIVDSIGNKTVQVKSAERKILLYDLGETLNISGDRNRLRLRLSNDSTNISFMPVKLSNVTMPLINFAANPDDGLILGLGFKHIQQEGFRKIPYRYSQEFFVSHSFSTRAYRIHYSGEWIDALGKADLLLDASINAPENAVNFYGRGNESAFNKTGDYKTFYRARFSTYQFDPSLRWKSASGTLLSIGPSFQYYKYNLADNLGRFITQSSQIGSYDSLTLDKDKLYAGIVTNFAHDRRNNKLLPSKGSIFTVRLQGYAGLNGYSRSFIQVLPEVSLYKRLNKRGSIVVAERLGGGVTFGKTAFYQSLFLGGQGNLFGYRLNRFAGQHMVYNNLEMRAKLFNYESYIVPGQFGLVGVFDIGRVWEENEYSEKWHNGVGAGIYTTAASFAVVKVIAARSSEGWYPNLNLGMRF